MTHWPHRGAADPQALRGVHAPCCRLTVDQARADAGRQLVLVTNLRSDPAASPTPPIPGPRRLSDSGRSSSDQPEYRTALN